MTDAVAASRIARIDFAVSDIGRTRAFYETLGFRSGGVQPVHRSELDLLGLANARADRLLMRVGLQEVGFLQFGPPGRPYPVDSTTTDLWFQHIAIIVSDMAEAYAGVVATGARPITRGARSTFHETPAA